MGAKEIDMAMHELEGYDEVVAKLIATLPLEQRLAGLSPDQLVLALPDELLRDFSTESLATLSEATRTAIRRRIGR